VTVKTKTKDDSPILVVDDDKNMCLYLETALSLKGFKIDTARSGKEALDKIQNGPPLSVVILDIMMPEMDGITTLSKIREFDKDLPVIMLSALGQIQTVVKAMRAGASDYVNKPFEDEELEIAIENALKNRNLIEEVKDLRRELEAARKEDFVTVSEKMAEIKQLVQKIAPTDVPVLIQGESGVGKEVVAKFVHSNSLRKNKPLIKVSCTAIPSELLESELFGYEKGAFSGAHVPRPGRFGLADKGTIFLDEIGDLMPSLQVKLLQVLQDGVFTRLGAKEESRVDVRILSATNKNLEVAVKDGSFREDLYHRLSVIDVTIPPLRERREDIPILCTHFLKKYNRMYNRNVSSLSREFSKACMAYAWPGNVRELENMIKRVVVLSDEAPVLSYFGSGETKEPQKHSESEAVQASPSSETSLKQVSRSTAQEVEKEMIIETLIQTKWNKKKAAERLGINYKTLLYKIRKFEI
jgi:two-component system, NtrC family, response regulator AtoC